MILLLIYASFLVHSNCAQDHKTKRDEMLQDEAREALGGRITLTDKELVVNNCLMQYKFNEIDYSFDNPDYFNFSHHYFLYKDNIRHSKVYKIIRDMPKGAALHIHDMGILGPDYLMRITYMEHLYVCFEGNELRLKFSANLPSISCKEKWQLMSDARHASDNIMKFDEELRKHFTLVVDDPDVVYPSIKETWNTFMNYFVTVIPMLSYRPVWEQYFYESLKKFREENIMYVEVRSILPNLYELDGTVYGPLITAIAYSKAIHKFKNEYPDFIGAKLIYAPPRKVGNDKLREYLQLALKIKQHLGDMFAGFDLVGQEDLGNPLIEFVPQLAAASKDLNYFFHAGETNWYGTYTDENLVDAILLGAKRLGHAYALPKHPLLMEEVVKRGIGLEVNVISNSVLSLVRDVRNHPLSVFFARNLPVVISSDDPGVWEADVISDDFYVSFVGIASKLTDLRLLKQLALNSLQYSALNPDVKVDALKKFHVRWNEFINTFKCSHYK